MSWDYLNSESEEVKRAFSQISETEKLCGKPSTTTAPRSWKNDTLRERKYALTCIFRPARCRTYGTVGSSLSPLSADETSSIPNLASAKHFSTICGTLRSRSNAKGIYGFFKRYFPYVKKLMPVINFLRDRLGVNDGIIRKLCEFKEVGIKENSILLSLTEALIPDIPSAPSNRTKAENSISRWMEFHTWAGSERRWMSLEKPLEYRSRDRIEV